MYIYIRCTFTYTRVQSEVLDSFTHVRHVLPLQLPLLQHRMQVVHQLFSHLHSLAAHPLRQLVNQRLDWVLFGGQQHHLAGPHGRNRDEAILQAEIESFVFLTSTSSSCSMRMPMVSLVLMETISSPDTERKIRPSVKHPETLQNIRRTTSGVTRPK